MQSRPGAKQSGSQAAASGGIRAEHTSSGIRAGHTLCLSSIQGFQALTEVCRHVHKVHLHAFYVALQRCTNSVAHVDDVALTLSGAVWWGQKVQHSAISHRREFMDVASAGRVQHSRRVAFLQSHATHTLLKLGISIRTLLV